MANLLFQSLGIGAYYLLVSLAMVNATLLAARKVHDRGLRLVGWFLSLVGLTAFAALAYQGFPAISFQGHPEFDASFAVALIKARRGVRFEETFADAGVRSLKAPNDNRRVGGWIDRFLNMNN